MRTLPWLVALCLAAPAVGDIIHLNDGSQLEGEVKKSGDGWVVTQTDGQVKQVPADSVRSIEITGGKSGDAQQAASRLASLRRACEGMSDPKVAIDRYQRFVEQAQTAAIEAAVLSDAQKDLATWQDRASRGLLKVGSDWITPAERDQLRLQSGQMVIQAKQLVAQGRLKDADTLLGKVIELDPNNAAALYVRALVLYRQDQVPIARKCLEAANAAAPDHAPTLNNLAVVLYRQKQYGGALNYYDQAMTAAPNNKQILDNVAEALNGLPAESKASALAKKVQKRFDEQDQQLQAQMQLVGWFRWGSTWVQQADMERLTAAEKEIKEKMAKMQADFDAAKARLDQITQQIQQNTQSMQNMQNSTWATDVNGRMWQMPLPSAYYEYQRENQGLAAEQAKLGSQIAFMRDQAKQVQQQLPTPRYTGVQQLIGVEGIPASAQSEAQPSPAGQS